MTFASDAVALAAARATITTIRKEGVCSSLSAKYEGLPTVFHRLCESSGIAAELAPGAPHATGLPRAGRSRRARDEMALSPGARPIMSPVDRVFPPLPLAH
jgi:hypothetical protein